MNFGGWLVLEGPYVDGKRHGHWVERENMRGTTSEGPYADGERQGQWPERDSDGQTTTVTYVTGRRGRP